MKFRCEQHYNNTWIELNSNSTNWIQIQLESNEMQIGGKCIENLLVNTMLKKKKL
jgi:hypothetical protein